MAKKTQPKIEGYMQQKPLQNDNVFVDAKIVSMKDLTGYPTINGVAQAVISEGKIVHVASESYSFLPNENYFTAVEEKLIEQDINYTTRSINRENRSFAVDYILSDESYHVNIKNGMDKIQPMLRFVNNYDGSGPTSGYFGFFRQVCNNGLHMAQANIGFKVRHHKAFSGLIMPNIKDLVGKFMENEYYSLHKKFQVLAETPITDLHEFVKMACTKTELFRYEASEKNPTEPSKNAELVMNIIRNESNILGTQPNLWLGYNAFNEYLHSGGKSFMTQKKTDSQIFSSILEMAN